MPPKKDVVKGKGAVPEKDGSSTYGARIRAALRGRGFLFAMLAIGLLALALRLAVSADLIEHDVQTTRPSGLTDMWTYKDLSEQILKGEYIKEFYYQPFYYAVFLPVAKTVFGNSAWAVALTQALAGTGAILLAGLIAAMLWGAEPGWRRLCWLPLLGANPLHALRLIETSQSFWLTLLLYLTLRAYMKGGWLKWGSAGLILSFAILTRGNAWIFLPGILAAVSGAN
jgi:4-amino-4-deoxy-L-arabinose transferase-like glycosyltransferase